MIDVRKAEKLWSEGVPSAQIGSAVGCAPSYVRVLARRHFWPNRAPRKDAKSLLKTVKPGTETKSKRTPMRQPASHIVLVALANHHHCRWPADGVSVESGVTTAFCGAPIGSRSSYCETHHKCAHRQDLPGRAV